MIDIINQLKGICTVNERDIGAYADIKKNGMHFVIHAYDAEGLGRFSTIEMKAMMGLMKMDTVVFTPLYKDMPLFSYDRIKAMGKETLLLECYDTSLNEPDLSALNEVASLCQNLPDHNLGEHWYDSMKRANIAKRGKKISDQLNELESQYFSTYLSMLKNAPDCEASDKIQKTAVYVDGLFEHGGPSTDQFKKMIGNDAAYELFSQFIFSSK